MNDKSPFDFDAFLLLAGRLNYAWTNTESLLIHLIAGQAKVDKETATIIFLTLNTARARIDLVERLAKMPDRATTERDAIIACTQKMLRLSALRNRYNHCIYAFDTDGGNPRSILMRIADRRDGLKMGQSSDIDQEALDNMNDAIQSLSNLNTRIWSVVKQYGYPA
ncbi:hypothetical protein C1J03_06205 [Sulfitobacter sp. SK012]|uniref:hypothetical protein n=1 Tax=Sulfitobacter sp. SK012 TaxID=1389005 RepID=UPI000E0ADCDB|nr:hypothetical protein [Sulfitobacter sp. SK012]AXI45664.1 hypothetical protein C1J03_06205 [Sulfitobacter sp. SK012]